METIYDQIYALAEPYWHTRSGEVHMPESYALAQQLLSHYPAADESVVLPAILLHDIGYFGLPTETQMQGIAGSPNGWDGDITRIHEQRGAQWAGELLSSINYAPHKIREIQQIIDGHDSRTFALSLNDAIVKDADKLWRFTLSGVQICHCWVNKQPIPFMEYVGSKIDEWMLTEQGNILARSILAATRRHYQEQADDER